MEPEKKSIKKWFENYWYYYKYHTIIIGFLSVALIITLIQCSGVKEDDYYIVLATQGGVFTESQKTLIEDAFAKYGEDLNGDGKVTVGTLDCSYSSLGTAYEIQNAMRQKLQTIIMGRSNTLIYITDDASFKYIDSLSDNGFLQDLGLPDDNGKSIMLSNTGIASEIERQSDGVLPKGLRVSRRIVDNTLIAKSKNVAAQQKSCDKLLKKMAEDIKK